MSHGMWVAFKRKILPYSFQKYATLLTLDFSLCETSDLQNQKRVNLCCFKTLNLFDFVISMTGNQHIVVHPLLSTTENRRSKSFRKRSELYRLPRLTSEDERSHWTDKQDRCHCSCNGEAGQVQRMYQRARCFLAHCVLPGVKTVRNLAII